MARVTKKIEQSKPLQLRKGDTVVVISGTEKGKKGRILRMQPKKRTAIVEGVNFVKRHQRPTQTQRQGGIIEKEGPIQLSKLQVVCGKCGSPTRVGHILLEGGGKARSCRRCDEILD